ncbi:MAG: DUF1853 family protein [Maribacter sp.]
MQEQLRKHVNGFLNTPPLWDNKEFGIQQFEFPEIDMSTFQAKAIPENIRLGHQIEYVFKQLIEFCPDYIVLLHNLPVKNNNRTIGEIDFILSDVKSGQLIHVELTYKFYIINPEILEPIHQLLGPNKHDAFFAKMEKIKNKQFQLLHTEEGSKALIDNNIDSTKLIHRTCYKAQLFEPYGSNSIQIKPLNTDCIVGYWLRFEDFNSEAFKKHHFYIPTKSQWVVNPHLEVQWLSHIETRIEINLHKLKEKAPMVWIRKSNREFEKFFVVWW